MKVDFLHIKSDFKNLKGVEFDFDKSDLMTVIIGRNGSGKSNVLEALALIFRNLDLGESPPFSYKLRYILKKPEGFLNVLIDANHDELHLKDQYSITTSINDQFDIQSIEKIKRDKKTNEANYLPSHVFAYYSGPGNRLEKYFETHRTNYYSNIISNKIGSSEDIRPLFYAKPYHSQFVLLAFLLSKKNCFERKFLKEHLKIERLDSVHFVLRKPAWGRNKDDVFWGARDGLIRKFLQKLLDHSLCPLKIRRVESKTLTGKGIENEFFHLFIKDLKSLKKACTQKDQFGNKVRLEPLELFNKLESIFLSDIISEINVRVKISGVKEPVTLSQLSEGEQQLLTVLGLIHFTGSDNTLFLLDEPDTHLNPAWSSQYLKFINGFLPDNDNSQLLMVTHHPLTISGLEKEQVQVIKKNTKNHLIAESPQQNPRGMGVSGILKSEMFGLNSTLDNQTIEEIKKRDKLVIKSTNQELSDDEKQDLQRLKHELSSMGFNTQYKDPVYQKYMEIRNKLSHTPTEDLLTEEELLALELEAEKFLRDNEAKKRRDIIHNTLRPLT